LVLHLLAYFICLFYLISFIFSHLTAKLQRLPTSSLIL
jgi:hypothetical protein